MRILSEITIKHTEYGVLIFGLVTSCELIGLMKVYAKIYSYDLCDFEIASHYNATSCLTTSYQSDIWRKHINIEK